jgi:signal transduction histidine kinase
VIEFLSAFVRRFGVWLAAAICLSAAVLVWIGYRAVVEWERAATLVATRRADAAADLLIGALAKDMRGVQQVVLASADRDGITEESDVDLLHPIGSAFARYPYPDTFFAWHVSPGAASPSVVFFARADRRPAWLPAAGSQNPFPVVMGTEPALAARLAERIGKDIALCQRYSVFDADIGGSASQVVAVISYADARRERAAAVMGFTVNLDWVRRSYFGDLTTEINHLGGDEGGLNLMIFDDHDQPVVGGPALDEIREPMARRTFPLAFYDPLGVALDPPQDLARPTWTAVATARNDPTVVAAENGARHTLGISAVMALALGVALLLSVRAVRASAELAEMRSEFVSTVTHELKTPIANIRAINETLAAGRGPAEMSREYAQMATDEAKRLSRLIDNLLAYAQMTNVADAYSFEPVALDIAVDHAVKDFRARLTQAGFEVQLSIPPDLPAVRADPTALNLILSNLLDNAVRYAGERRQIAIAARRAGDRVALEVADQGVGIAPDEVKRVTRKFFRGRTASSSGSGLGLAIVERIVADHGGSLEIRSELGAGTTVAITLPSAGAA